MTITFAFLLTVAGFGTRPADHPHAVNPVFRDLSGEGWGAGGKRVAFPPPTVRDGMTGVEETEAVQSVAGPGRALAEFTRDSVTAPVVLKTKDVPAEGGVIRQADLWFVVRAPLDAFDPDRIVGQKDHPPIEAGNMRFEARAVRTEEVPGQDGPAPASGVRETFARSTGRLLDRILVESTERITATRSEDSWVIASTTDRRFDQSPKAPNRWSPLTRRGAAEEVGVPTTYAGGVSYVKATRLRSVPGALLVEVHFAFFEPNGWFQGAPILKSKFSLVAQDRVRAMRRELSKSQNAP